LFYQELEVYFFDLEASLRRTKLLKDFTELENLCFSNDINNAIKGFRTINMWLDEKGVTKIDTRMKIDPRRVENENSASGL